jgi:hypothetical protein
MQLEPPRPESCRSVRTRHQGNLDANLACGIDNPEMESFGIPSKLPLRPFLDIGMHARTRFDLWSTCGER